MDQDNSKNVMIALLPSYSEWCKIDLPHLTLVFCGTIGENEPTDFNKMAKDAAALAQISRPITLEVMSVAPMGPADDLVDALILRPTTELLAMRLVVEKWNKSTYPTYRPHATVGPYPTFLKPPRRSYDPTEVQASPDQGIAGRAPESLRFDRISVHWGDDCLPFNLG